MTRSKRVAHLEAIPKDVSLRCAFGRHEVCTSTCVCACHDRQPELPIPCDHHGGYRAAAGVAWCRRCGIDLEVSR